MDFKSVLGLLFGIGIILQEIGLKGKLGSKAKLISQTFIVVYVVLFTIPTFFSGFINGISGR